MSSNGPPRLRRYTILAGVGVVTTDEQAVADFGHLLVAAFNQVAQALAHDEMFQGRLELFAIDEDEEVMREHPEI